MQLRAISRQARASVFLKDALCPSAQFSRINGVFMSYILQVDFPYTGPWGPEMTAAMDGLARSIANEPGLVWKIWTENQEANEAGGIYCFNDAQSAKVLHFRLRLGWAGQVLSDILSLEFLQ
jgi:hypothetical protein